MHLTRKIIPEKILSEIAHTPKGLFMFKTDSRKQFHPYEILNYTNNHTLIVPLKRTATGTHKLLDQHGYNLTNTHFIDMLSKHIGSGLEHKNTTHIQNISLKELAGEIERKIKDFGPGPKTLFIDDAHTLIPHHGVIKTLRFMDYISRSMASNFTKTIILANNKKLPKEISKFLFTRCDEVIEMPE